MKILYTNANVIPYQSSTSGKLRLLNLSHFYTGLKVFLFDNDVIESINY